MNKANRRVGTCTFGVSLILFGIIFLIKLIFKTISYTFIFKCWPVILIFLGVEILIPYIKGNSENIKYDWVSFILIGFITMFTIGMACVDFIISYTNANATIVF